MTYIDSYPVCLSFSSSTTTTTTTTTNNNNNHNHSHNHNNNNNNNNNNNDNSNDNNNKIEIDNTLEFVENNVRLQVRVQELAWKPTWKKVKAELKTCGKKRN